MCVCVQSEAIPENLKNMLLVMETAGIFQTDTGTESKLWRLTWDKIDTFLPHLREEIFKPFEPPGKNLCRIFIMLQAADQGKKKLIHKCLVSGVCIIVQLIAACCHRLKRENVIKLTVKRKKKTLQTAPG